MRPQTQPHHTRIIVELCPNHPKVKGNNDHIQDVWINLLLNAKEAVSERDKGIIKVTSRIDDESVIISIADNGHGIAPAHRERIFNPFFTTKQHGAGLGLSICHDVIAHHGGTINVQSDENDGTIFSIVLPLEAKSTHEEGLS